MSVQAQIVELLRELQTRHGLRLPVHQPRFAGGAGPGARNPRHEGRQDRRGRLDRARHDRPRAPLHTRADGRRLRPSPGPCVNGRQRALSKAN